MTSDVFLILLSAGLTALGVCVGWLIVRIIDNSREIAVLQSRLGEADIPNNFKDVHGRITELSECTHKILGLVEIMERRQGRVEDHLMSKGLDQT